MAGAAIGQKIASDLLDEGLAKSKQAHEDYRKGIDIGIKIAEDINRMINDIKEQSLSEYLGSRIRTIMNDHADQIAGGGCKDFASYQRLWCH